MSYLAKTPEGLLPCPHCGGEAEARDGSSTTPYIRCKSCGCRTGSSRDMDRLKEAWNRRAERTCRPTHTRKKWECDVCGCVIRPGFMPEFHGVGVLRYCPNCGARVIEEDE